MKQATMKRATLSFVACLTPMGMLSLGAALIASSLFVGLALAQEENPAAVPAPGPTAPGAGPAAPAPAPETVLLDDDLSANAKTEGNWVWDTTIVLSGTKSHGHPSGKGAQSHSLTFDPVTLPLGSMVTQQVWLDPADPPKGIMVKFRLATGEEVGVYWEGEEEVFTPGEEEEVWYYGLLPELGEWTTLEVLAEDLGVEEEQVTGLSFVTHDGRALWDKTALTQAPPLEELEEFTETPALAPGEAAE